jgi:hypothetical protein
MEGGRRLDSGATENDGGGEEEKEVGEKAEKGG